MTTVEAVHPNTEQVEQRLGLMNKYITGFLYHYLVDRGIPIHFIIKLVEKSVEPELAMEAPDCVWDKKQGKLTTPNDSAENGIVEALEFQSFYKAVTGEMLAAEPPRKLGAKTGYANTNLICDLDGSQSPKTVHQQNDGKYSKGETPETLDLSREKTKVTGAKKT